MARIGIIGATGTAGSALFKEALKRQHEVTAIVRDPDKARELLGEDTEIMHRDAFGLAKGDLMEFDVVVNAFATDPSTAKLHVDLAQQLVGFFREEQAENSPLLFFILGAGSLLDEDGNLFIETLRESPDSEEFISIPESQLEELEFLRELEDVKWVGISPSAEFVVGEATDFEIGKDHLLKNDQGESVTSSGTLARAILDEIENPQFQNERFTVVNKISRSSSAEESDIISGTDSDTDDPEIIRVVPKNV